MFQICVSNYKFKEKMFLQVFLFEQEFHIFYT
jgi:hypothetical protein